MSRNSTEENRNRYKGMKNKARKVDLKSNEREKAEQVLTEVRNHSDGMFRLVKESKINGKEVDGGKCMRGSVGKFTYIGDRMSGGGVCEADVLTEQDEVWLSSGCVMS